MLRQLRSQHTMKWIMGFVAFAVILWTVFVGMDTGGGRKGQPNVIAVINDVEIPSELYSNRVNQLAEADRQRFGRDELTAADYERIDQQAWDGMVQEVILNEEARRLGLEAQDEEIIGTLRSNPPDYVRQRFLDDNGQFDPAAFQAALNNPDYPWLQDEQYMRAILPTLKLQQLIRAGTVVSEAEVRTEYERRTLRNTVRYVGVEWRKLEIPDFNPTDDELRAYLDANQKRFSRGENVVLDVIRFDKAASRADVDEVVDEAHELLQELRSGAVEDFAALAELYSEDPSASRGGSLGWVTRGTLPDTVEAAVWALSPGERTKPIGTPRGVYIVQVDSVRAGSDDDNVLNLRELLLRVQPSNETSDSLRTTAFELADDAHGNFEKAASKHGLSVERLAPIDRSGFVPDFGFSLRLRDWAFGAKVGEVGGPFGSDDAVLVARVAEKHDLTVPAFEEIESRVRNAMLEERKKALARQQVTAVLERVKAGATLKEAARAEGLEVQEPAPFTYYESVAGVGNANEFTAVASELKPGQTSGVVEATTGAYVLELVKRDPFDEAAYAAEMDTHYQSLFARRASEVYEAWLQEMRDKAKVDDRRGPRV